MSLNEDEKWLKLISGRETGDGADPKLEREAELLRQAFLRQHADDESEEPLDAGGAERLMFRLKREGLLEETTSKARFWRPLPAAIAAMLALAVILPLTYQLTGDRGAPGPDVPEWTQMRGGVSAQVIRLADPGAEAADIVEELKALGLDAKAEEFEGSWYVDTYLPLPISESVSDFLERRQLKAQADGRLVLEITDKPKKPADR